MKSRTIFFLFVLLFVLVGCTPATPTTPENTEPPPSTEEPASPPPDLPETVGTLSLEWLKSLSPQTIVFQMDYEPTFSIPEAFFDFGRVPPFTLFADGTVIYIDEGQTFEDQKIMAAALAPEDTFALAQQIFDLGFTNLESYTDDCKDMGNGTQMCVADASYTILRAQMPDGEFREIKIFHDFANDPDAFQNITSLSTSYTHPNAQPFVPENASLFITPLTEARGVTVLDWPLDPQVLKSLRPAFANEQMTAIVLKGEMLEQFLAAVTRNTGYFFFTLEGQDYSTALVPWLPGEDFTEDIHQEFPAPEGSVPNPDPSNSIFANCPAVDIPQAGTLRLAYVSAGDLWVWDSGQEPVQITSSGDVYQTLLTEDGSLLFYVREAGGSPELWMTHGDGSAPTLLLAGKDLRGDLQFLSPSFDNQWIAFTHALPEGGGELWVANVDGTDTHMLVSQEDLMSIVAEPLADYAYPAGVTWIPNTYTLTYDAQPGFEEDGIYIYVQNQVWVADALTGEKGVLFPEGEGGQVSYSPDGTTMIITTPDSLRAMNIEAKDIHSLEENPGDFNYFAVGFGEYYQYPALVWTADSQTLLIAQPNNEADPYSQDAPVSIWQVPVDGSPATKVGEFNGFFPSFVFSPDRMKVAYWRAVEALSNTRELHVSTVDGSEHVTYETASLVEFQGWAPDSQSFLYVYNVKETGSNRQLVLGNLCQPAYPLTTIGGFLLGWLDANSFLYLRLDNEPYELFLGATNGAFSYLLQIESRYDYAVLEH